MRVHMTGFAGSNGTGAGGLGLESDIWSAAACVVHMASGKKPFDSLSVPEVQRRVCEQVLC